MEPANAHEIVIVFAVVAAELPARLLPILGLSVPKRGRPLYVFHRERAHHRRKALSGDRIAVIPAGHKTALFHTVAEAAAVVPADETEDIALCRFGYQQDAHLFPAPRPIFVAKQGMFVDELRIDAFLNEIPVLIHFFDDHGFSP